MNAPLIWIFLPAIAAVLLWIIRQARWLVVILGAGLCLLMAILAEALPIDQLIYIGKQTIEISSEMRILGRLLAIEASDQPLLIFIYLIGMVWFVGAGLIRANEQFIPLGLASLALWVAALCVQPFLYAALIIEVVVLISIPMLINWGEKPGQGILKYLIYQTMAVPFILLAGWVASGAEANPADETLVSQTAMLLGIGLAFLLAIFPFYTWASTLASETHPLSSGFILSVQPVITLLFALNFLDSYAWLRELSTIRVVLLNIGVLMVILGGFWAATQQHMGRLFGYLVVMQNGIGLVCLSLESRIGVELLLSSFMPRILCLGVLSTGLAVFRENQVSLNLDNLTGILKRYPFASVAVILSIVELTGLPGTEIFPIIQILMENVSTISLVYPIIIALGSVLLLIGCFRLFAIFIKTKDEWHIGESRSQMIVLALGIMFTLIVGVFSGVFFSRLIEIIQAFPNMS